MASKGAAVTGGVIDAGYRGEILVVMNNLNRQSFEIRQPATAAEFACGGASVVDMSEKIHIKKGDKIAQMIPQPVRTGSGVINVDELPEAQRGDNGFGSSGR
jgi:dUTP pyrophosphatase